jgi:hypothetical protein
MPDKAEALMWRQRAAHYRVLAADPLTTQVTRNMLLALAREADALAQDIEDRLNGGADNAT